MTSTSAGIMGPQGTARLNQIDNVIGKSTIRASSIDLYSLTIQPAFRAIEVASVTLIFRRRSIFTTTDPVTAVPATQRPRFYTAPTFKSNGS